MTVPQSPNRLEAALLEPNRLEPALPEQVPALAETATTEATLIFNTKAGGSERCSPDHLVEALHRIGYRPVYRATDSEDDLLQALREVQGTVFVAGGDGTIRAATLHLAGREGVVLDRKSVV